MRSVKTLLIALAASAAMVTAASAACCGGHGRKADKEAAAIQKPQEADCGSVDKSAKPEKSESGCGAGAEKGCKTAAKTCCSGS